MTNAELGAALVIIGPYIAVEVCKAIFKLKGPVCRKVNTLASTALGAGVVLVVGGEPLERVAIGAIAAGIAWLTATGVHGGLDRARDALTE
jgi:hypothetical protein